MTARQQRQAGSVFLVSLFFTSIVALQSMVGITRSFTDTRVAQQHIAQQAAFQAAEAALENAKFQLRQPGGQQWTPAAAPTTPANGRVLLSSTVFGQTKASYFTAAYQGNADLRKIIAEGFSGTSKARLEAVVEVAVPAATGGVPGIFGATNIEILDGNDGPMVLDAYDSTQGAYDPLTSRIPGQDILRSNTTSNNKVELLRDNIVIHGRITVGQGGNPVNVIDGEDNPTNTIYGGYQAAPANLTLPPVAAPPACTEGNLELKTAGAALTLQASHGPYHFCSLAMERDARLITAGGGEIVVYVDGNFKIGGGSPYSARIEGNTKIRFVVKGTFEIQSTAPIGITNAAGQKDPKMLKFDLAGSGTAKLVPPSGGVAGNPTTPTLRLFGQVYAPSRTVEVVGAGRAEIFGALAGNVVKLNANETLIHADVSIGQGGGGGGSLTPSVTTRYWNHLPPS